MNRSQVNHDIRFLRNRIRELEDRLNGNGFEGIYCRNEKGKLKEIKALKRLLKYIKGYALYEKGSQNEQTQH